MSEIDWYRVIIVLLIVQNIFTSLKRRKVVVEVELKESKDVSKTSS